MPPPLQTNTGSRAALITWTVITSILFVVSTVLAIFANVDRNRVSVELETLTKKYEGIVRPTDLDGDVVNSLKAARSNSNGLYSNDMKLLNVALKQRDNLATVINTPGLNSLLTIYPTGATPAQIAAIVGQAPQNNALPAIVYYIRNGQQQNALQCRGGGAAEAFADHDGGAAHRSDEHLPEEAELPVPHHRRRREQRGEQHRHGENARIEERFQVHSAAAGLREVGQAGAQHEQEEERLDQRGDEPGAVVQEANHLALPDDLDGTQLTEGGSGRHPNGDRYRGGCRHGRYLLLMRAMARRFRSPVDASASRMVVPV